MATFADRLLVYLSKEANLATFLKGMNLDAFFTKDFQARFNSEFWQITQVAVNNTPQNISFEQPAMIETRILGRKDHYGNGQSKTNVDYRVYGMETALWTDAIIELDTTWQADQIPGTVVTSQPMPPPLFQGVARLVSVLRIDPATNHPLDRLAKPLADITLDNQGRLQAVQPNPGVLTLDPSAGVLLLPDGKIHSLALLELFPRVGAATPLVGALLGEDGQPLPSLLMDSRGAFTDLAGAPARLDPLTGLPLDGNGKPVHPALLTIPDGDTVNYRFMFSLPVQTDKVTFNLVTRLYLFALSGFNLVDDLRKVLTLRQRLEQRQDYLLNLSDTADKLPGAFALVYDASALAGSGLVQDDVRQLGASVNVLIHFFAIP